jgi:hypothetical protein
MQNQEAKGQRRAQKRADEPGLLNLDPLGFAAGIRAITLAGTKLGRFPFASARRLTGVTDIQRGRCQVA